MATAIDPICKMDVDTDNPPGGQSDYAGTTYYFCAPGCKVAFDKEPDRYLNEEGVESGESDGHEHHDHDHGGGHDHGDGGQHQTENKPGFLARLFGKK